MTDDADQLRGPPIDVSEDVARRFYHEFDSTIEHKRSAGGVPFSRWSNSGECYYVYDEGGSFDVTSPEVDAVNVIQREIRTTHLRSEVVLTGDKQVSIEDIYNVYLKILRETENENKCYRTSNISFELRPDINGLLVIDANAEFVQQDDNIREAFKMGALGSKGTFLQRDLMYPEYREPLDHIECPVSNDQQKLYNAKNRLREIIRSRQSPIVIASKRSPLLKTKDERERVARSTLQTVIGDKHFRRFIKRGFIAVKAKSGKIYQIFPGHDITCVYENGKMVERLCVVLSGDFPPTDSLIMRYLLILNDETDFRKKAIPHEITPASPVKQKKPPEPLTIVFKQLKAEAGLAA